LPEKLLVIGGGPIGIEISQAMSRLGSRVTVVHHKKMILEHDDETVSSILYDQLQKEGIQFYLNAKIESFVSANETDVSFENGSSEKVQFDAVFVAVGRELNLSRLQLQDAGIEVKNNQIVSDRFLRTTNKDVFVCGDVAGDLKFSHAAEFHARILLNNLFSPFKKKLDNDHLSWVTFTDPEVATLVYLKSN
jgi:pyruvate/2-oxoglutarate dehydrogenase complex dihydrolipoamide dehydrogenase (E3) component